ncbi:MAG TPA: alpha/beta fold hydrolase [Micropepsaceae bacterium]|jgi:pimeloyl-ACP methyl ester carboxylesterase
MTYYVTVSDGTDIAYDCMGDGLPLVLIHGFGANRNITWSNTNWYQTVQRARHKLIAIDCRGHGESEKPHEPADYDEERMAMDVIAVLAALEIPEVDVMGYSMGAQIAIRLMHDAPGRVRRTILAGIGENYFRPSKDAVESIAAGLLAKDATEVTDPVAREYRSFCEKAGDDLVAMAACIRRPRRIFPPEELRALAQKVLVVCGEQDDTAGSPGPLSDAFRDAATLIVPKRNHHSTVGDRSFKDAVVAFLAN